MVGLEDETICFASHHVWSHTCNDDDGLLITDSDACPQAESRDGD